MPKIKNEFKELIPPLTPEEYNGLEASILQEGCRDAIVLWNDFIIDGHNRFDICTNHGIEFKTITKEFANENDVKVWIIQNQFGRRNLSAYTRSILALKLEAFFRERAKEHQKRTQDNRVCQISDKQELPIDTKKELAKIAQVSHDTIAKVKKIQEKAPEEVKKKLRTQEISINQAFNEIKKEERKENIKQQKIEIEKGNVEKPTGLFDVIVIDPPWEYGREYDPNGSRIASPYPEMSQEQLKKMGIPAKDNSIIFLWTTHQFIWDAKELLDFWGFKYRCILTWNKEIIGIGNFLRMQCEFCLIGIKGKPFWSNTTWRDIITEKRREHSRKPEEFYKLVNECTAGNKLDMFSREKREGFEVFGNDIKRF